MVSDFALPILDTGILDICLVPTRFDARCFLSRTTAYLRPRRQASFFTRSAHPFSISRSRCFVPLSTAADPNAIVPRAAEPKVKLHEFIRYSTYKSPMTLDLRESPNTLKFRACGGRPLTNYDLTRFVCEPPLPSMRFYHAQLPWYIDVEAQNPSGVTLYDMFCAINQCMMTPIQHPDYYNVEMSEEARNHVMDAWMARCRTKEERLQGIRRVDYLMGRVIMEGIQKGKDGLWEIKTRKPGPP